MCPLGAYSVHAFAFCETCFFFALDGIDWQADKGEDDAAEADEGGGHAGEEELVGDDVDTADDGDEWDHWIEWAAVGAWEIWLGLTQAHDGHEGEGVEDPAGKHCEVGEHVELAADGVDGAEKCEYEQGEMWHLSAVELRKPAAAWQEVFSGEMIGDAAAREQEAVGGAEHGDHDADGNDLPADVAENGDGDCRCWNGDVHHLICWHDPEIGEVHDEVDGHDDGDAADDGERQIFARIFHFTGDGANGGPAFKCEEHGDEELTEDGAEAESVGEHWGEDWVFTAATYETEDHEHDEGNEFADGEENLRATTDGGTEDVQHEDDEDADDGDRHDHGVAEEERGLLAECNGEGGDHRWVEENGLHPACEKTDAFAKGFFKINDHAAGFWDHDGDFGKGHCGGDADEPGDDPGEHAEARCAACGGVDGLWLEKDAAADNAADDGGHCCGKAEVFLELLCAFLVLFAVHFLQSFRCLQPGYFLCQKKNTGAWPHGLPVCRTLPGDDGKDVKISGKQNGRTQAAYAALSSLCILT